MDKKLLFEVDLSASSQSVGDKGKQRFSSRPQSKPSDIRKYRWTASSGAWLGSLTHLFRPLPLRARTDSGWLALPQAHLLLCSSQRSRIPARSSSRQQERSSRRPVQRGQRLLDGARADVTRRIRKFYVGYFRGKKSFFAAEPQKLRLWIYSVLDPGKTQPWNGEAMRDVTSIGHFGMGDTEYSLASEDQLDELRERIQAAYDLGG